MPGKKWRREFFIKGKHHYSKDPKEHRWGVERARQSRTAFICNFVVEFGSSCRADGQEKPCEVGAEAQEKVGASQGGGAAFLASSVNSFKDKTLSTCQGPWPKCDPLTLKANSQLIYGRCSFDL